MNLVAVFLVLLLIYCAVSRKVEQTLITAPILFTIAGVMMALAPPIDADPHQSMKVFLTIAEIGLVLTLFTDASRTDLRVLKSIRALPARLLSVGMLLTIALGLGAALMVFGGLSVWEAGVLAAILAPTDAGLGLVIVNSPKVPLSVRQALNVEAGLNDGLSVPFLMFFIALTMTGTEGVSGVLARFAYEQLGLGTILGLVLGFGGGWLLGIAGRKEWISHAFQRIGMVTLPLLCVVTSEPIGASMFIAAFVGGLAVQVGCRDAGKHSVELAEEWGQFLNLAVFFLFGLLVARAWEQFTYLHFIYGALSLTIVRIIPVMFALRGSGLSKSSILFMGWFGPRGLASIVLGLIYVEQMVHTSGALDVRLAVMATVLLSILLHGLTAGPGIDLYARLISKLSVHSPERAQCDVV